MSAPVFLAESARLEQYPAGSVYVLDGPEGRHAGVVQRRRAGEQIDVVDGELAVESQSEPERLLPATV